MNIDVMHAKAMDASSFLQVLSNPNRLLILCHLIDHERSVGELERLIGLSQPLLSQQLARLRRDGLVETRRQSTMIFYRLGDQRVLPVLRTVYNVFCRGLMHIDNDEDGAVRAPELPAEKV